jgi:uncharacterized protein with von Willebrand factor type A (vWA) domain
MTAPNALQSRLHSFVDALRTRGLPVSLSERIDALRAVETIDLAAAGLHTALSATLVKNSEHLHVFDEIFGLYFRSPDPVADPTAEDFDLEQAVRTVLEQGSAALARLVAELAVARFSEFIPGRAAAGLMYERQAVQGLGLDRLVEQARLQSGAAGPPGRGALSFDLDDDPVGERAAMIREQIRTVVRKHMVADRGAESVSETVATPLTSDIIIGRADAEQLREIRNALKPLQRKLATTLMRKRRHHRAALDVRATVRASMSTGAVPMRVHYRRPNPTKPDLYVLADLSGSVANFAAFSISLVSGLSELFSRCRSFAFIEAAVEVTEVFGEFDDPSDALRAVTQIEALNFARARTDYGRALGQFWAEIGPHLGRRSTVLIFGDGRGNYRPGGEEYLAQIAQRAGSVHWLNPEPRNLWGGGDSRMTSYEALCTDAISCRTLNDVRRFIETLD